MVIDYKIFGVYEKVVKTMLNLTMTIPFFATVVCCTMVVMKLRNNTREQEQFQVGYFRN
jgi:hypothetical protein